MCNTTNRVIYEWKTKMEDNDIFEDGSLRLNEKSIRFEQKIKLVIHSNEQSSHNLPHVHAFYNSREYVITIDDDFKLLKPEEEDKYIKYIRKAFLIPHVQKCREYWNETNAIYKFVNNEDGKLICPPPSSI